MTVVINSKGAVVYNIMCSIKKVSLRLKHTALCALLRTSNRTTFSWTRPEYSRSLTLAWLRNLAALTVSIRAR